MAAASSAISGGDCTRNLPSKYPSEISRVLFFNKSIGRVMLLVISRDMVKIASRHAIAIVTETFARMIGGGRKIHDFRVRRLLLVQPQLLERRQQRID